MRERTRFQKAGELSVFLSACLAGLLSAPVLGSILALSVLLLCVGDRGQHWHLVERARRVPRVWVLGVSLTSHLALNAIALGGAYGIGWAVRMIASQSG